MNPRRVIKKQKEAWSKKAKAGVKTKGREKKQLAQPTRHLSQLALQPA